MLCLALKVCWGPSLHGTASRQPPAQPLSASLAPHRPLRRPCIGLPAPCLQGSGQRWTFPTTHHPFLRGAAKVPSGSTSAPTTPAYPPPLEREQPLAGPHRI